MINEEKVLRMTRLASYEARGGKKDKAVAGYFKGDYIGMQQLLSFVIVTAAFLVAGGAYICFHFEEVIANLYTMDMAAAAKKILWLYLTALVVYLAVTYVVYLVRYLKARRRLNAFLRFLNSLDGTNEEEI